MTFSECTGEPAAEGCWAEPPSRVWLGVDELQVWRARLDLERGMLAEVSEALSADERERARRFRFPRDQARFAAARGLLRQLLARYVGVHPRRLRFAYAPLGKPSLDGGGELRFNLSHSGEMMLVAVTRRREVGVDVERIRTDLETEQLAERFFSPSEVESLRAVPPRQRASRFFVYWTRKEAYIKARGEGLSIPLSSFSVSPSEAGRAEALTTLPGSFGRQWSLTDLCPDRGYAAAVVAEGASWRVAQFDGGLKGLRGPLSSPVSPESAVPESSVVGASAQAHLAPPEGPRSS